MNKFSLLPLACLFTVSTLAFAGEPGSVSNERKNDAPVFNLSQSDLKLSFGGRIQMDAASYYGSDFQHMSNGVGFRRVRLNTNASFGKNLSGKVEIEAAGGGFALKECFLKYDFLNGLNFRMGNFQEGFSMLTMTSSGDFLFIEHPNVISAFSPEYHMGVQGAYQKGQFLGQAGVHFQKINGSTEKDYVDASLKSGQDEGVSYTMRSVWMPFSSSKASGFHLGAAASYRTPKTDGGNFIPNTVRYGTASLTGIDKVKYLDTKAIGNVSHDWLFGGELAAYCHGVRFQSEYILNQTHRMGNLPTEKFNGYYAEAACMLFGGEQKYVASKGAFAQPSSGKEWGDVEVAARYDRLDMNAANVNGGQSDALTLGVNYYASKYLKFQLNYSYVNHDKYANGGGNIGVGYTTTGEVTKDPAKVDESRGKVGNDYSIVTLRAQLNF